MDTSFINEYKVDANLDASDNVFPGIEPSPHMLTNESLKLE